MAYHRQMASKAANQSDQSSEDHDLANQSDIHISSKQSAYPDLLVQAERFEDWKPNHQIWWIHEFGPGWSWGSQNKEEG